ncbi:MAG: lipid A deacylase LpxR family protein [Planctomycetes bacterium]|nr:lipid A deacylase LpxR family protein [Planctomycetota bacterium]MCB9886378.1 lipid A deacylase LpxR family protein [Planctomycetota bacterium]
MTRWLSICACAAAADALSAQQDDVKIVEGLGVPRARLRARWENDSWLSNDDRFYTNGAGLGWTLADGPLASSIAGGLTWLPLRAPRISGTATEFSLRQQMFTPEDIQAPQLLVDDRPYAGWLYLEMRHQILALGEDRTHDMLDSWFVQAGVVGPSSLAEDTQTEIHRWVDAPRPQGWSNQLHDEPGLVVGFRRDFRSFHDVRWPFGLESDFEGHYAAHLGNVDTSLHIGAQVRLGWDLPRHFGTAIDTRQRADLVPFYMTAGVSGRNVLRNVFLDGNTFRGSHSVSRNWFVADFHVALYWEPTSRVRLGVGQVFGTPEFDSPSQDGDLTSYTFVQAELLF